MKKKDNFDKEDKGDITDGVGIPLISISSSTCSSSSSSSHSIFCKRRIKIIIITEEEVK